MKSNRLREIDFLRGIAILLVLMRHQYLFQFTKNMGWIGVDLFFVLSGFLVSGLLFKEYIKYGNIKPGLFLIRRGFKIYPIYYLFYILYLIPILINHKFVWKGFVADMFFVQNYVWGWGYAYPASWSLAVEEHFYFGFALLLWIALKKNLLDIKEGLNSRNISKFEIIIIVIMIICFCMRIYSNTYFPNYSVKNTTMTHLRIDSLLAGVLISYLCYFRNDFLTYFFNSHKIKLLILSLLLLSFSPLFDPLDSFFIKTIGFTFLYIAFGIVLIYFLLDKNINTSLNKYFSKIVVNMISKIGFSSYSIYIIHSFVNYCFWMINNFIFDGFMNQTLIFISSSAVSIFLGITMTTHIERYFLNIRDRLYPSRIC